MTWLRHAAAAGFRCEDGQARHEDFNGLRGRAESRKLIAELEAKRKSGCLVSGDPSWWRIIANSPDVPESALIVIDRSMRSVDLVAPEFRVASAVRAHLVKRGATC